MIEWDGLESTWAIGRRGQKIHTFSLQGLYGPKGRQKPIAGVCVCVYRNTHTHIYMYMIYLFIIYIIYTRFIYFREREWWRGRAEGWERKSQVDSAEPDLRLDPTT